MDGSFALICWKDKILLFRRDNIPTIPYPDHWQLPGGRIEQGETHLQALKRELMEEVSYVPKNLKFVEKVLINGDVNYLYIAFVNDRESIKFKHGPGEGQEIGFFTINQALKLKLSPALKNKLIGCELWTRLEHT